MKVKLPIIAAVVAILILAALFGPASAQMPVGLLALLGAVLISILLFVEESIAVKEALQREEKPAPEASKPAPVQTSGNAQAEVIAFLSMLQEKGRLIDFLMSDLEGSDDAAIGAAARVVHQGCRAALKEHLKIQPMVPDAEGSQVTVPAGYSASQYKLTGKLSGSAPFTGTLVHKGWRADEIKLPKVVADDDELPALAPAQVEVA